MSNKSLPGIIIIAIVIIVMGYFVFSQSGEGNNPKDNTQASVNGAVNKEDPKQKSDPVFYGEKGESIEATNGQLILEESSFDGTTANYYNTRLEDGDMVYFFVVRDRQGTFRAAANACQVCFSDRKGFSQKGDYMVCDNCRNQYAISKIATEKGGCNPGPINPDIEVVGGKVIVEQAELEEIAYFFN